MPVFHRSCTSEAGEAVSSQTGLVVLCKVGRWWEDFERELMRRFSPRNSSARRGRALRASMAASHCRVLLTYTSAVGPVTVNTLYRAGKDKAVAVGASHRYGRGALDAARGAPGELSRGAPDAARV